MKFASILFAALPAILVLAGLTISSPLTRPAAEPQFPEDLLGNLLGNLDHTIDSLLSPMEQHPTDQWSGDNDFDDDSTTKAAPSMLATTTSSALSFKIGPAPMVGTDAPSATVAPSTSTSSGLILTFEIGPIHTIAIDPVPTNVSAAPTTPTMAASSISTTSFDTSADATPTTPDPESATDATSMSASSTTTSTPSELDLSTTHIFSTHTSRTSPSRSPFPIPVLESQSRRDLLGGLLDGLADTLDPILNPISSTQEPQRDVFNELVSGVLGDVASIVGFQPLIDACNEPSVFYDPNIYAALTYTANTSKIVLFKYGDCVPYETKYYGNADKVYFCKPGYCHTYDNNQCSAGFGNIGPVPLPIPAGFFLPNVLDADDLLGHGVICKYNGFLGGL